MSELHTSALSPRSSTGREAPEHPREDQVSKELDDLTRGAGRLLDASVFIASITSGEEPHLRGETVVSKIATHKRRALFYALCLGVVNGEPLIVEDDEQIERSREGALRTAGVRSCLCFPLRANASQVIGLLCVLCDRPRAWRKAELSLVSDLAQLAAIELRHEAGMGIYSGNELHLRTRRGVMQGLLGDGAPGINDVLGGLCRNLRWDAGSAWFVGADRGSQLECTGRWAQDQIATNRLAVLHKALHHESDDMLGQICARQEPSWTSDLTKLTGVRRAALASEAGFKAGLWFPVINDRSALGVVELLTTQSEPQHDQLPLFALALGRQIGDLVELTASRNQGRTNPR